MVIKQQLKDGSLTACSPDIQVKHEFTYVKQHVLSQDRVNWLSDSDTSPVCWLVDKDTELWETFICINMHAAVLHITSTLMMDTETLSEMLAYNVILTFLIAWEEFVAFNCCEVSNLTMKNNLCL
jgi:hypothetical protein